MSENKTKEPNMSVVNEIYQIQKTSHPSDLLYELLDVNFTHDGFCIGLEIEVKDGDANPGVHIYIGNKGEICLSIQQMSENIDEGVDTIDYELNKKTSKWELSQK